MSRYNLTHLLQNLGHVVRLMRDAGYGIRAKNETFDTEPCRLRLTVPMLHAVTGGRLVDVMSGARPGAMAAHYARLMSLALDALDEAGFLVRYENVYDPAVAVQITIDGVKWSGSGIVLVDVKALIV